MDWSCNSIKNHHHHQRRRGRPYIYSTSIILRCFVVRIWFRLDSNRALHEFLSIIDLPYNRKVMRACGLSTTELQYLPSRRTFDRRLKTVSKDIKERIVTMGHLFVLESLVNPYILATQTAALPNKSQQR